MDISAANRIKQGMIVTLDGVDYMVKSKPFGSASFFGAKLVEEEVTLTLIREVRIINDVERVIPS